MGLAKLLLQHGCYVRAFDPRVVKPQPELEGITLCSTAYQAAEYSDVLVVMTPWPDIKDLDFSRLRNALRQPVLIDAHNCLDARKVQNSGLRYVGTGVAEDRSVRTVLVPSK